MSLKATNKILLYVGNLPWTVANRQLREYFSTFGQVASCDVSFDPETGMSRSYGFVCFRFNEGYEAALKQNIHFLEGRVLKLEMANMDA